MGCDSKRIYTLIKWIISIHAPIVGCDRGARGNITRLIQISIHAPIVGCDITYPR